MLRLEEITVGVGGFALLENASLHIRPGDRLGIVGPNGAGKTSLLRVIIGETQPESGRVIPRKDLQIGYLAQKGVAGGDGSVWEEASVGMKRILCLEEKLQRAHDEVESGEAGAADRLGEAEEAYRLGGGYAKEERIGTVLDGLGFGTEAWHRPVSELSGGWQMRVALARLLLSDADLLVLDEPTNHLDMQARSWLASFLKNHPATIVLVSHDRLVLDQVTTRIAEIYSAKLWGAPGNLSRWLSEREQRLAQQLQAFRMQQAEIARLERFVERFKAKATKAAQARSRQKILDRMERVDAPDLDQELRFRLPDATDSVYDVLKLVKVAVGWPKGPILADGIGLELHRGMRLALVGVNGCGKSTLLKVLSGSLEPVSGEMRLGKGADIGAYDQDVASTLPLEQTPLEYLMSMAPKASLTESWSALGALGLGGEAAQRDIGTLSGGERSRVALALLSLVPHNVLLLDEPTNHLDAVTIDALVEPLITYAGAVVIVSHDRYLIEKVATHVGWFQDGTLVVEEGLLGLDADSVTAEKSDSGPSTGGESYKEAKRLARQKERGRKQIARLEVEVEELERQISDLNERLFEEAGDFRRAQELEAERSVLEARMEACYTEWEALEESLSE